MQNLQKYPVLFLCSRLDYPGGTERAIANTANLLQKYGHRVTLIVLEENADCFYPLHPEIRQVNKPLHFGITPTGSRVRKKIDFLNHVRQLRKLLDGFTEETIISTDYAYTIAAGIALGRRKKKLYSWEHHHFHFLNKNRFWRFLHKKIYRKLSGVIALNKEEQYLFENYGCRAVVIPNFIYRNQKLPLHQPTLLSVGWLIKSKGVDLIPAIAEKIFRSNTFWKWRIIGEGAERETIASEIRQRGLSEFVEILPATSFTLSDIYGQSSIYVMTSRSECFPMVVLEAFSFGIPCVAFDCPTGPREIIKDGEDGRLIDPENIEAMANTLLDLMEDDTKREAMGARAYQNVERFSPENIYPLWEKLLSDS